MTSTGKRVLAGAAAVAIIIIVAIGIVFSNRNREPENADSLPEASRQYSESPILRDRVERGELPPVNERLPKNPLVVTPIDSVGRYSSEPD